MSFGRVWPDSLGSRTVVILVTAVLLVHLGSMFAYRTSAVDAASEAQSSDLAERVATATRAVGERAPMQRDITAHELSSEGLSLRWSERTSVETQGGRDRALDGLRLKLTGLLPEAAKDGIHVDFADRQPPGDAHAIIGSVRLADASFVSFAIPTIGDARSALRPALLSTSIMAGGVALVSILLVRTMVSPLRLLARAADAIGRGPDVPVSEGGPNEVRQLAKAFNAMQHRIDRLLADRTQALAAVSHDLRTPLTRLRLRAGFLADPETQAAVDSDLDEMEAMIDATLAYLRGEAEPEPPKVTDLASLLSTIVDGAADRGRAATFEGPRRAYLPLRALAMKRALGNVVDNALSYGGTARVWLADEEGGVRIGIDDDGPGIPAEDLERVFEPFQRLEQSRNRRTGGAGLGLTIARQAVARENGSMTLMNRAEGGLRVEIVIPRRSADGVLSRPHLAPRTGERAQHKRRFFIL